MSRASLLHQIARLQEVKRSQTFGKKRQLLRRWTFQTSLSFVFEFCFWGFLHVSVFIFFLFLLLLWFVTPLLTVNLKRFVIGENTDLILCKVEKLSYAVMKEISWSAGKEWIPLLCHLSTCISQNHVLICIYMDKSVLWDWHNFRKFRPSGKKL